MSPKNDTPILILSLLLTLGLLSGGFWLLKGTSLGRFLNARESDVSPSSPAASPDTSQSAPVKNFSQAQNLPSGLFSYGGSTTWAPIRGAVDPVIQQAQPAFRLRYIDPVNSAPGSTAGIRMLIENQLTFAQSSRSLKPEELQAAQQRGYSLKEIPIAIEGIAVVVHPNLNLPGLTLEQLKGIYTGQIQNWQQVGGPNLPIAPLTRSREEGGTIDFFVENVLGGANFGSNIRVVNTTTQAIREVSENPGGIYFASAPEVVGQCTVRPLPIGRQPNALIPPYQTPFVPLNQCPGQRNRVNRSALQRGDYPLTRRLFVVVKQNGQVDQQAGEAYANFLLSEQGQTLLAQLGFVPIR